MNDIKTPEKKITVAPPVDKVPDQKQADIALIPWPDGFLLKHQPNPKSAGSHVLLDGAHRVVALAADALIADFLCKAASVFMVASQQQAKAKAQAVDRAVTKEKKEGA